MTTDFWIGVVVGLLIAGFYVGVFWVAFIRTAMKKLEELTEVRMTERD